MKNVIIVEGKTDKLFLEGYLAYVKTVFPKEYFLIEDAKGQDGITKILKAQKININKGVTQNIGILLDADDEGITAKIKEKINPAIQAAFGVENAFDAPNKPRILSFGRNTVNIFCYIFNFDGKGELEDILKEIRRDQNTKSTMCLDQFVACLAGCNEAYPEKEYKKNFIYFYGYDCLKSEGTLDPETLRKRLHDKEYYTSRYWNFEHDCLQEVKAFLALFERTPLP